MVKPAKLEAMESKDIEQNVLSQNEKPKNDTMTQNISQTNLKTLFHPR